MQGEEAFIIDALRTPMGRYGGALATVRPDDMAAHTIRHAVERNDLPADRVDEVVLGCANQAGEDCRNVARMASLLAGLPVETPAYTVNRLCASGLDAVVQAARAIKTGEADLVLAGGVESMSRAPYALPKPDRAFARGNTTAYDTAIGWRFINPRIAERYSTESMGETAENVSERYQVSREDQDAFALASHRRTIEAQEEGRLKEQIVPIEAPQPKGGPLMVGKDEGPRADTSLEKLARLVPIFREGGSVTAGNSSTLNDGAACLTLASNDKTAKLGKKPLARIMASASCGVDPAFMGIGPIPATRKLLEQTGLKMDDIDLVELNEAFACQALVCMRELSIEHEKMNVNGGAIALGHPLGCSGARLLTSLVWELNRRGGRYGLATMCVGIGQGVALLIENIE